MTWAAEPAFREMEAADAVRILYLILFPNFGLNYFFIIRFVKLKTCLRISWTPCSTSNAACNHFSRPTARCNVSVRYEDDRRTLKSLVKAAGISVKPDWDIERFKKMLSKTDGADAVMAKTQNVDMFFTELLERCHPPPAAALFGSC